VGGATTTDLGTFGNDPRPRAFIGLSPQGEGQFGFGPESWVDMKRPTYTIFGELESDGPAGVSAIDVSMWRRQPYNNMPHDGKQGHDKFVSMMPGADHNDLNTGTGTVAQATQDFIAANSVAFFDTFVRDIDRRCEIGQLDVQAMAWTDRK